MRLLRESSLERRAERGVREKSRESEMWESGLEFIRGRGRVGAVTAVLHREETNVRVASEEVGMVGSGGSAWTFTIWMSCPREPPERRDG